MSLRDELLAASALAAEALAETLWPTRCAICDLPGHLLCPRCCLTLPYLDHLLACPLCGAAYGRSCCTECNRLVLDHRELDVFPLDGCASSTMLSDETRQIVTTYKDRGERRLAGELAHLMADCLPWDWTHAPLSLIPIPAQRRAVRKRGFDHMALIGRELERCTGIPYQPVLTVRQRRDQRTLDARDRMKNMAESFTVPSHIIPTERVILVDDVMTTGATLFAAAEELRRKGVREVFALTFVRA